MAFFILRYVIKDPSNGELLYSVFQADFYYATPFFLTLVDKYKREIIKIKRATVPSNLCCGLDCRAAVKVYVRNYKTLRFDWMLVGSVKQFWSYFGVFDKNGTA